MIGDALATRLEPYEINKTKCYREVIEWLNTTDIRDVQVLGKNVALRLPGIDERAVPRRVRRKWIIRQVDLAAKAAQRSGE